MIDKNNLFFYSTLKTFVKLKITSINEFNNFLNFLTKDANNIYSNKKDALSYKEYFIDEINSNSNSLNIMNICLNLIDFKNYILINLKRLDLSDDYLFTNISYKNDNFETYKIAYNKRIEAAYLLKEGLINWNLKNIDSLENIKKHKKLFNSLYCYELFSFFLFESLKQSGISNAGNKFENKIKKIFSPYLEFLNESKKQPTGIEFDLIGLIKNKKIGISIKRTFRERARQNIENINNLNVDYIIHATLGSDFTESKFKSDFESYDNHFIFVPNDMYKDNLFFIKNKRIISFDNIKEFFDNLLN